MNTNTNKAVKAVNTFKMNKLSRDTTMMVMVSMKDLVNYTKRGVKVYGILDSDSNSNSVVEFELRDDADSAPPSDIDDEKVINAVYDMSGPAVFFQLEEDGSPQEFNS